MASKCHHCGKNVSPKKNKCNGMVVFRNVCNDNTKYSVDIDFCDKHDEPSELPHPKIIDFEDVASDDDRKAIVH